MDLRLEEIIREYQGRRAMLDAEGVYFLRDISDDEAEKFAKTLYLMALARQFAPERPITVYINSGGGSVGAGFAIIEMIASVRRQFGVRVDTVVLGYAYSMGAVVFQAGDQRRMGPFSTLMLHGGSWVIAGDDDNIFRDVAKLSRLYRERIGDLFAERTGRHDAAWWRRFIYSGRDKYLSAAECLQLGLCDLVSEPALPSAQRPGPVAQAG
jgi:ATP-dependent Clp protease protease subunit